MEKQDGGQEQQNVTSDSKKVNKGEEIKDHHRPGRDHPLYEAFSSQSPAFENFGGKPEIFTKSPNMFNSPIYQSLLMGKLSPYGEFSRHQSGFGNHSNSPTFGHRDHHNPFGISEEALANPNLSFQNSPSVGEGSKHGERSFKGGQGVVPDVPLFNFSKYTSRSDLEEERSAEAANSGRNKDTKVCHSPTQQKKRKSTFGELSDLHPAENKLTKIPKEKEFDENDQLQINLAQALGDPIIFHKSKGEREYESTDNESKMLKNEENNTRCKSTSSPQEAERVSTFNPKMKKREFKQIDKATDELLKQPPVAPIAPKRRSTRVRESQKKNEEEFKGCTCQKSECIKLYCECFVNNNHCSTFCTCTGCFNMAENDEELAKIRKKITARDPLAFTNKIKVIKEKSKASSKDSALRHVKGCKCKKSHCMNNYCECHQLGAKCTELCKCRNCQNEQ